MVHVWPFAKCLRFKDCCFRVSGLHEYEFASKPWAAISSKWPIVFMGVLHCNAEACIDGVFKRKIPFTTFEMRHSRRCNSMGSYQTHFPKFLEDYHLRVNHLRLTHQSFLGLVLEAIVKQKCQRSCVGKRE